MYKQVTKKIDGKIKSFKVKLTTEEIKARLAEQVKWEEEQTATEYIRNRRDEYLPLDEQFDLLYHDKKNGTNKWFEHIDGVKSKYPKK